MRGDATPLRESIASSAWFGLGIAAALGVIAAVVELVPISADLGIGACALCGALSYYGFDRYWWLRQEELERGPRRRPPGPLTGRAREVALAPSFEVYDPRRSSAAEAEPPPLEGE